MKFFFNLVYVGHELPKKILVLSALLFIYPTVLYAAPCDSTDINCPHARDHASTHFKGGQDQLNVISLYAPSCTNGQVPKCDGANGMTWQSDSGDATAHYITTQAESTLSNEVLISSINARGTTASLNTPSQAGRLLIYSDDNESLHYDTGAAIVNVTAAVGAASSVSCSDCVALETETSGSYVEDVTAGAGLTASTCTGESSNCSLSTASNETGFLASGALSCGASTAGKMQVHTTPLQYCDNAATPTLRYSAYGDSSGNATTALNLSISGQATGDIIYNNAGTWTRLAPGTSGQLLKTNGAGVAPSWVTSGAAGFTVEEEDGSPSVANVSKIQFPNGTVTNDSGTIVSVNTVDPQLLIGTTSTSFTFGSARAWLMHSGEVTFPAESSVTTFDGIPFSAGTLRNLGLGWDCNGTCTSGTTFTATVYKNGSPQTLTCTTSGSTAGGSCSDTSNTVTVTAGQKIYVRISHNQSSETIQIITVSLQFVPS